MKRDFAEEGIELNLVCVSRYLRAYLDIREELEAWSNGVKVLSKIAKGHPQSSNTGLGMMLQLECQYL